MIALYLSKTEQLPSRQSLIQRVLLDVGAEKREAWYRQSDKRVRESLSGILLLQRGLEPAGFSPEKEILHYEPQGRPYLESGNADFSISHADGITACAVMWGTSGRVGVDVERFQGRSQDSMKRISGRWFTQGERKLMMQKPDEAQFLRIWTGKEALSKRMGGGLGVITTCDVTELPEGVKLKSYSVDGCVLTLCFPLEETPPQDVKWIDL